MSVPLKSSTADGQLQEVFGAPVADLYATATGPDAPPALTRALELRSFLALAEEQVARVRDRVHEAMAPDRDMGELSVGNLRFDAQWLEAALDARHGYRAALGELLRTMPPPDQQSRPVRTAQPVVAAALPRPLPPRPPRVPGRQGPADRHDGGRVGEDDAAVRLLTGGLVDVPPHLRPPLGRGDAR